MIAFYKQRFSNAADFTFFMVGAFKIDEALPLLRALRRRAAVDRDGRPRTSRTSAITFPPTTETRQGREGTRAEERDRDQLLRRSAGRRSDGAGAGAGRDRRPRDRPARHPARGARADLHRVGGSGAGAAAARRRLHRGQLRRRAREHREDERARDAGSAAAARRKGRPRTCVNRAKETARRNYETQLRPERLLAAPLPGGADVGAGARR